MSFDVLSRTVSTNCKMVIEASAGTGKTFTIEHLFIKRLLEDESDANIAVITFTKAVAKELSIRIRNALDVALSTLTLGAEFVPDYIQHIREQGDAKVLASKRKLHEARCTIDRAMITTIHGFCNRLLSDYAGFDCVEKAQVISQEKLLNIVHSFFRTEIQDSPVEVARFSVLLQAHRSSFDLLTTRIVEELWNTPDEPEYDLEAIFDALRQEVESYKQQNENYDLFELAGLFTGCANKSGELKKELVLRLEHLMADTFDLKTKVILHPFFVSDWFSKPKAKAAKILSEDVNTQNLLLHLQQIESYERILADPECIFRALCRRILQFVRKAMQEERLIAYDELLHEMANRVVEPAFQAFLEKRISCLIVDEFQDTDPLQWKILKALPVRSLFLVGDPKQAIYAFRNADVYSYMEAKKAVQSKSAELYRNFRSSDNVIFALNTLFTGKDSQNLFYLPKLKESITPQPLLSSGKVNELEMNDGKGAIAFFEARGTLGKKRKWPTDDLERVLIQYIADELLFLTKNNVEPKSCAVLVKDRYQAKKLEGALVNKKIPAKLVSRRSIVGTIAHQMLKRLIRACERPRDKKALIAFLSQEPLKLIPSEIGALLNPEELEPLAHHVQHIVTLAEIYQEKGLAPFIQAFLDTQWVDGSHTIEESILALPQGYEVLSDLEQITDRLLEQEVYWGKNFAALSLELALLDSLSPEEKEKLAARSEETDNAVSIMTLFASKGLEFDVVFALGAASRGYLPPKDPEERDAEAIRLFYVAATRAKKRLYIPYLVQEDQKPLKLGTASPCELFMDNFGEKGLEYILEQGKGTISHHLVPSYAAPEKGNESQPHFTLIDRKPYTGSYTSRTIRSFSGLMPSLPFSKDVAALLPIGKEAGTLLHALLQTIALSPALFERIDSWLEIELAGTLFDAHKAEVSSLIKRLFTLPLKSTNDQFTLSEIDWKRAYPEMEFVVEESPLVYMRGTIDLAFEHHDRFYLLDYKSHAFEGEYTEGRLKNEIITHGYDKQARIYSKAITQKNFGGFFFIFLRAEKESGVVFFPPEVLV